METYLDLSKGLHQDFEEVDQIPGTYRYLINAIRQLSGAIENEKGTSLTTSLIEEDRRVLGSYVLDSDIIFFSYAPSTNLSEIGILEQNGDYNILTNDPSLAFTLDIIIRAEGKKNFKGERIIYFVGKGLPMRVLNIDSVPTSNFNDNTKLILTADMPQVKLLSVDSGGQLPTGVYQFGVRLLTKSTNSTSVSILTNPIPVIDEEFIDRDRADGAPPQTESNKAITIQINNIDIDYEFLEIVVVTPIGTANVTEANIIARLPIQGRNTLNFTYSNTTQIREPLDINALVVDPTNYESAEFIFQKDGILGFAGLTSTNLDYNFQPAANSITIKYVIKEETWNESIQIVNGVDVGSTYPVGNDYKNPLIDYEFKSYMRDEVYSFAITPIFTNWSMGSAYHIPALVGNNSANTTTKALGTYNSSEVYPTGKGYPTGNVRHHRMPTLAQEPHAQVRSNITYIRMLGIQLDLTTFLTTIPTDVKKQIIGYVITKQKRDATNASILSQGIATGHTTRSLFGNIQTAELYALPFSGNYPSTNYQSGNNLSLVAFYSPESIITKDSLKSATRIKPVIELLGTSYLIRDKREGDNKFAHVLLNYNNTSTTSGILTNVRNIDNTSSQYIEAGAEVSRQDANSNGTPKVGITGTAFSVITWRNPGYTMLKLTNGDLPLTSPTFGDGKADVYYKYEDDATDGVYLNNVNQGNDGTSKQGTTSRFLYNVYRTLPNQYGNVFDAKYHYVKHLLIPQLTNPLIEVFNGDTFISKFAVMSSANPDTSEEVSVDLKAISYYWSESQINTGLRHYKAAVGKEGDDNYVQGTLPYYPKVKILSTGNSTGLGLFDYSTSLGHPIGYNKQYSFENIIRTYIPTPIELDIVSSYPNRIIYSDQSIEGEQLDAYRIFLPNNYHDIPKEKGNITNIFILAAKLYVHTQRSLWKTYFNEQVTQINSEGEAYLGNGGVFYRPSTEVITVKGGYAGTRSSSGFTTPFGHFFIDNIQKKVFMFSDELKEISDQGMFKYFKANIEDIADIPGRNTGYSSVYDYENKRWLLTKIGQWTLSYSTQLNSWSSFHSYTPYHYVSNGDRLYSLFNNTVNEMNIGVRGVYYGELPAEMRLDIIVNDAPRDTKTLDNLFFYTTSKNNEGIEQHYDTFSTLQVYNTTRNSGKCRLTVPKSFNDEFIPLSLFECFAKLKSNEFRVSIPNDLVIDVNQSIFEDTNLDVSRAYRPRISGKYFVVSLSYNNLRDNKFILHNIGRMFRQRIR